MRVLVLTSSRIGTASRCLPALCSSPGIDVAAVVLARTHSANARRQRRRKIEKIRRIGILGALNGIRIRSWFADSRTGDIGELAAAHGVPLIESEVINSEKTRRIFRELDVELGLSLGNGYIASSVFTIPKRGMINVHGEILPAFRGAQPIIWPIHEGVGTTGYTIHMIDESIDHGAILRQRVFPIQLYPTLRETVEKTLETTRARMPEDLRAVVENFDVVGTGRGPQGPGRSYTTPTLRQFLRMRRRHREMLREAGLRP